MYGCVCKSCLVFIIIIDDHATSHPSHPSSHNTHTHNNTGCPPPPPPPHDHSTGGAHLCPRTWKDDPSPPLVKVFMHPIVCIFDVLFIFPFNLTRTSFIPCPSPSPAQPHAHAQLPFTFPGPYKMCQGRSYCGLLLGGESLLVCDVCVKLRPLSSPSSPSLTQYTHTHTKSIKHTVFIELWRWFGGWR